MSYFSFLFCGWFPLFICWHYATSAWRVRYAWRTTGNNQRGENNNSRVNSDHSVHSLMYVEEERESTCGERESTCGERAYVRGYVGEMMAVMTMETQPRERGRRPDIKTRTVEIGGAQQVPIRREHKDLHIGPGGQEAIVWPDSEARDKTPEVTRGCPALPCNYSYWMDMWIDRREWTAWCWRTDTGEKNDMVTEGR